MVGVSVAYSSIKLVPSVIRPTVHWWIPMVGCQCRLLFYRAGAKCKDGGCQCHLFLY